MVFCWFSRSLVIGGYYGIDLDLEGCTKMQDESCSIGKKL